MDEALLRESLEAIPYCHEVIAGQVAGPVTKGLLAPVVLVDEGADPRWLVMARCDEDPSISHGPDDDATDVEEALTDIFEPLIPSEDCQGANLGRWNGTIRLRDYGRLINELPWTVDHEVLALIEENAGLIAPDLPSYGRSL